MTFRIGNIMKKKRSIYLLALLPFLVLTVMYEIIPLIGVVISSFISDENGAVTAATIGRYFQSFFIRRRCRTA